MLLHRQCPKAGRVEIWPITPLLRLLNNHRRDEAQAASLIKERTDATRAALDLDVETFDAVGGADIFPMQLRKCIKDRGRCPAFVEYLHRVGQLFAEPCFERRRTPFGEHLRSRYSATPTRHGFPLSCALRCAMIAATSALCSGVPLAIANTLPSSHSRLTARVCSSRT
jgi:hypothetical protein